MVATVLNFHKRARMPGNGIDGAVKLAGHEMMRGFGQSENVVDAGGAVARQIEPGLRARLVGIAHHG